MFLVASNVKFAIISFTMYSNKLVTHNEDTWFHCTYVSCCVLTINTWLHFTYMQST